MSLNISLDKFYLRQSSETYDRLTAAVEDASTITTWYGRGWLDEGAVFTNFAGLVAKDLFDDQNIIDGGNNWAAAGVNFTNYRAVVARDDFDDQNITDGGSGWVGAGVNFTNA